MAKSYSLITLALCSCAAGFPPGEKRVLLEDHGPSRPERTPGDVADDLFEQDPGALMDPEALWNAGDQALRSGRTEEAAVCFERAAALAPARAAWKAKRAHADALVALRRFAEAEALYRSLLEGGQHPVDSTLEGNLAMACFRQGKLNGAREAALRAIESNPGDVEAAKTLGLVEVSEGNRAQGAARLAEAVVRKPQIPEAQVVLAEISVLEGRPREAMARYWKLLEWLPEALTRDYHRRWSNLFVLRQGTTADELKRRIASLEAEESSSDITERESP